MNRPAFPLPRRESRVRVGVLILAAVLGSLAAGQILAAPYGASSFSSHGAAQ